MPPLAWLVREASRLHGRYRRRRRIGPQDALYRLEPEDYASPWRRVSMQALIRAHARVVPLDDGTMLCRVLGRYAMVVDGRDRGLSTRLMLEGFWDYSIVAFIARTLRPGQVAVDVGANLGFLTVLMADIVGPSGRVEAIEPNDTLARLAERNLVMNGVSAWARVHRAAAAERGGEVRRLRLDTADPKNGHLLPPGAGSASHGTMVEFDVPTLRLDDQLPGPVHFVKVDVEGAEEAVWAGMQGLLDRSPDILLLMEVNRDRGTDPAGLLRAIAARFPLRQLGANTLVTPVTAAEALARDGDTLLVLTRRAI